MLLSISASSVGDGGLASSASLITLCLNVDYPIGGFLTIGDGLFSMEGLVLVPFTSVNPPYQSEELHSQCVLLHLLQNSQYLPKNFLSSVISSSDVVDCVWSIKIFDR